MNIVFLVLIGLALIGIECFIGGTRLIYSLPAYGIISAAAILSLLAIRRKRIPPDFLCILSTLLLGAWVLYRASHSPVPYLAWPDLSMMTGCLMVYLLTAFYLSGTASQGAFIAILWAIAAAEVLVGMVQFIHDQNFMLFGLIRPRILRASGMYISPNNFAGFLAAVAVLSFAVGTWSRWKVWAKILAFYVAAFCLAGVAISGSRGGYFDVIGSMLCFVLGSSYIIRTLEPEKALLFFAASLTVLIGGVAVVAFLMSHNEYLTRRMQTMVVKDVRLYNWEAAIDHIRVSPWVGTGSGTHLIYGRLFRRGEIQADPVHAHCDYLELLAEYGIVGGLLMAFFLFAHIRNGLLTFSIVLRGRLIPSGYRLSNRFAIQFGVLCAVTGLAIHSIVDFDMHIPANAMIFAFLFGILANAGIEHPPSFVDLRITPWARLVAPALGVFMLWWGMPLIPAEYYGELARRALRDHKMFQAMEYASKGINGVPNLAPAPASAPSADDPSPQPPQPKPSLLDRALSKTGGNPRNPDLYFLLGEANRSLAMRLRNPYLNRPFYEAAAGAFESGLRIFPQDEDMLVRYGQVLDGLRRFDDAEVIYQRALHWDPNLGILRSYYENHLLAAGKKAEAAKVAADLAYHKVPVVDSESVNELSAP